MAAIDSKVTVKFVFFYRIILGIAPTYKNVSSDTADVTQCDDRCPFQMAGEDIKTGSIFYITTLPKAPFL